MDLKILESGFQVIKNVQIPACFYNRMKTGIPKIDDFFGGGLLPGSSFTLTAKAGLGKSTLILQILEALNKQGYKVGHVSCEESIYQLAFTCKRIGVENVETANMNLVEDIIEWAHDYHVLIVDSFQGLTTSAKLEGRKKEEYCINAIANMAKSTECCMGVICHHTKMGDIKGSSEILHVVDANFRIDLLPDDGDPNLRILSSEKNRFGGIREVPILMTDKGYVFDTAEPEEEEIVTISSRRQKRQGKQIWKDILNLPQPITIKDVMPICGGDLNKAMCTLREMTLNSMIIKNGRGNDAVYKILSVEQPELINK